MKFRTIFVLFNVVIVASFLFVFLMPFFLLGAQYSFTFWKSNWYLALFFLALIGGLNAFFLANRRVFLLVEREDWSSLSAHLVDQMFRRGRFRPGHVRLLVNAYLLQSDVEGIERLEAELASRRPDLLRRHALLFGVTRLLRNKSAEAETFFASYLDAKDVESKDWLRFDYAFSLVLQKRIVEALPHLREGSTSRDAVLALLSAYLLGSLGAASVAGDERAELLALASATRKRLRARFPGARWSREIERAKNEVHIVILTKLIDDASVWLASGDEEGRTASEGSAASAGADSPGASISSS
ncbi:MAG TPA: hypothetical protein VMC79_08445 [Rectinemataceae bacterium]|nr:hypothetical protein [Rectinemataceae bacterium]